MSTQHERVLMVCLPVPEHLWRKDNPSAKGYKTYVPGFYEQHEDRMLGHPYGKIEPGTVGILYDGRDLEYCWFGALVAYRPDRFKEPWQFVVPPISSAELAEMEKLVAKAYEPLFGVMNAGQTPKLRYIDKLR